MPLLLLELLSEEIPARMQARAEEDLLKAVTTGLKEAGLSFDQADAVSGPRRLAVVVHDLAEASQDVREERKGPKVGAPDKAIEGFLRSAGLTSIDQAEVRSDPKKGDFYVATIESRGRPAVEIIAELVPQIVRGFSWPKSMRSGTGDLRWVRPLKRILCIYDGKTVPFDIDGLRSGAVTEGHRVHGPGPFTISGWNLYKDTLEGEGHVILSRKDRKSVILRGALSACQARGLELVEDEGLLEEVVGLAEWPVAILGDMDPDFLSLPPEVIRLSMRTHQKFFAVSHPKNGRLAPHFVTIANIEAADGGETIAAGNARVLSARLSDARFFWDNDRKTPLESAVPKLARLEFKKELGSMLDKTQRVAALSAVIASKINGDSDAAQRAGLLCKADLVSEMVYEFPELQGVMGRYYALEQGESAAVASAIGDHYKPQGPSDDCPGEPVSVAVAMADKMDTLTGFWAIDEKPTGSKDPFALRRAALGVVRLILENKLRLPLGDLIADAAESFFGQLIQSGKAGVAVWSDDAKRHGLTLTALKPGGSAGVERLRDEGAWVVEPDSEKFYPDEDAIDADRVPFLRPAAIYGRDLLEFFADRLKQVLKAEGRRHDLIDAVFALGEDDLLLIASRVEALGAFLDSSDGASLMAGYKRAANILKAEEKKDGETYTGAVDPALLTEKEERDLHGAISAAAQEAANALANEDFEAAMAGLSTLRGPVDAFFEAVIVNDDNSQLRRNRLYILSAIRDALHRVADFSKIEC